MKIDDGYPALAVYCHVCNGITYFCSYCLGTVLEPIPFSEIFGIKYYEE